jgi:CRP-like cAMP-binding protein
MRKRGIYLNIHEILNSNPVIFNILKDCPYEIFNRFEIKEYKKGEIVCEQDKVNEYFYIILRGSANIYIMAENGRKYSQSIYKKGDYIGELEIFDLKPYICTVEAYTDLTLIRLHRDYFLQWVEKDRNFLLYITKTLCNSFYALSQKAGQDTLYSLRYRVCTYLISCLTTGRKTDQGIEISVQKEQLGSQFVVTERSINRILKYLKEKGIIEVKNKSLVIIDIDRLKQEQEDSRFE